MKASLAPLLTTGLLLTGGIAHADALEARLYKNPSCGCCTAYARQMEAHGFDVEVIETQDIGSVKQAAGIPYGEGACHTIELEGYVIEGHVPFAAIDRLLEERPDIDGIGLAGMPTGTPGMPGPKQAPYEVKQFTDREASPWMTI
ncbi:DUF411 domain-containing protein [Halomonas stenophila]|uniref:DUF411 domain-containing protein n=1 Tax=Halomonas stenophila TaxID=795312 RepID=A0A7W5HMP0_9GAMM|nr:DUF411 domain-containing protein [Halomonas stenophila]MBB3232753.1 hypothetical protein [Halomonas stenophila]